MDDGRSLDVILGVARKLLDGGNEDESEAWYRRAAEEGHVRTMAYLGALCHKRGDLEEAEKWYLLAVDGGDIEATINLAALRQQEENFAEAERLFGTIIDSPLAKAHFAHYLASRERFAEAIEAFREVIPLLPAPSARAHAELGDLLQRAGQLEDAIPEYRTALVTEDERVQYRAEALEGLGAALKALDRDVEAEAVYRQYLNDEEQQLALTAGVLLGRHLFDMDRFAESEITFRNVAEEGDGDLSRRALSGLGTVYLVQGNFEQAEVALRAAVDRGGDLNVLVALAGALLLGDRSDEAEVVLERIDEFGDSGCVAWAMLGNVFYSKDRFDEAAIAFEEAIACCEGDALAFAYLGLGNVALEKEDLLTAKAAYRKAIELESPDAALAAHTVLEAIEEAMREEGLTDEMLEEGDDD